ncbi:MAG: alpha-2-macroglobulin, partial [Thiohalocapsa sp.]|nr:alpha-2-macroglobulin [Thiohalocapsa sp.]
KVITKDLLLAVRDLEPPLFETTTLSLEPGGAALRLAGDWLARARDGGFVPGTASALVSADGAGAIDVPGIVRALDGFPYGCAEQVTSRALPLLYLDRVAVAAGLPADADIPARIDDAVRRVLANQSSGGGFGLWAPGSGDLWLDAYVTDFLTRAREQGHDVPETAFSMALDNLRNQLGYAADFKHGGEGIAYALYVLARNARVPIGDLRYYLETKLDALATPMARAQLGAPLALYGERRRAGTALQSALTLWLAQSEKGGWREDYGSHIRDGAALLVMTAEADIDGIDPGALATRLQQAWSGADHASTQDQAWMLLAAHALMQGGARPRLRIDGDVHEGAFYRALSESELAAAPLDIANVGDRPVAVVVTATGVPRLPPAAGGSGYAIERAYYDLDGRRVDPARIRQGERLVVLLTVRADAPAAARLIVDDPLPAGLEIGNPNLLGSGSGDGLPWLKVVGQPAHAAFRAERFAAAVERGPRDPALLQLAYVVRAVSPGSFAHPAATVADMYRPRQRARTASGRVDIVADTR